MSKILPNFNLQERDLDLLLLEELAFAPEFSDAFQRKLGLTPSPLLSLRHSVSESFGGDAWGETDILIELASGRAILIENKLTAAFQPEQAQRYRARAKHYGTPEIPALTVLVAPQVYLIGVTAGDWDHLVSFSDLAAMLSTETPRGKWRRSHLLDAGLRAARVRNLANNSPARKAAHPQLASFKAAWLAAISAGKEWQANPQVGFADEFLYRARHNPLGLTIWHHPMAGYISVQIPPLLQGMVEAGLPKHLPERMKITRHPSTIYFDAVVPTIDMTADFISERDNIEQSMATARQAIDIVEAAVSDGKT